MTRAAIHPFAVHHDTAAARRLRAASNPDAGIVVAGVPPDMLRSYELTQLLLFGFGKAKDVTGAGRHEDQNWELLAAWTLAHEVRHLVLVDSQWLTKAFLANVVGLAAATGVELWLVAHQPVGDGYAEALAGWPTEVVAARQLDKLVRRAEQPGAAVEEGDFPAMPADNYPTFRAEARRRMAPDAFEVVDARYREAYWTARTWFTGVAGDIDEEAILGLLRPELHRCASAEEMLVVVRAVQAAAHRSGWVVSVELSRLVVTAERAAAAAVHSPHTWRRLRAYRQPYRGAACALVACELALEPVLGLTLADVGEDGKVVAVAGKKVKVPVGAELYLRAQVAYRRIQGATEEELLFATEDGPMRAKSLADAVRNALTELGVPLYSQQVERAELSAKQWAQRWGISVQEL